MTSTSHSGAIGANTDPAEMGMKYAGTGNIQSDLLQCIKAIFPVKTWAKLANLLGLSERGAKHRMAGTRRFTADELARLLHSEHGFKILVALMADQQPRWWRVVVPLMQCADAQQLQIAAKRKLRRAVEGALDADAEITAAIARADSLLDADFMRPHSSALRSMARVPDRTVAPATKPRRR